VFRRNVHKEIDKMPDALLIFSTCSNEQEAKRLARTLVEERFAACVNVIRGVESVYRWENNVETATECLLLIKTAPERFDALRDRLQAMHSYEVPEIVAVPIVGGLDKYLAWLKAQVHVA
jgi:periplasmic divalent cation tolerance protein